MKNAHLYAIGLVGAGIGAYALVELGPAVADGILNAPTAPLIAVSLVMALGAGTFAWPQLRRLLHDKDTAALRASLNPVVRVGIGNANEALDAKVVLDPQVREAHRANTAECRFPPSGFTGKLRVNSNGAIRAEQPLSAGNEPRAAVQFAEVEDNNIRTTVNVVRDLIASQFKATRPGLVNTFAGAHFEKGTTAIRSIAFQGDALSWQDADFSVLHLLHEPIRKRARRAAGEPAPALVEEATPEAAPKGPAPRKSLVFPVPRPAAGPPPPVVDMAPRQVRARLSFDIRDRSDLVMKGMVQWAHGAIALARVASIGDHARVDKKLMESVAVAEVAAQWSTTMGAGKEMKALSGLLGCGFIGSFSESVLTVPSRGSITAIVQQLSMHGVKTLEGFELHPGDSDADNRGRRVVCLVYGAPDLVREIGEPVRKALGVAPAEFILCAAGVPGMAGAKLTLFVEASAQELDEAFPGILEHPGWPQYIEAVERWNEVKRADQVLEEVPA